MRGRRRWPWLALVLLVLLVPPLLLAAYLHSAYFRADLTRALSRALGYPVRIDGPLRIRWGRVTRVDARDLRIASGPGFQADFLRAARVETSLALWPWLWRRQLHLGPLTVQGAELRLIRNRAGRANWQTLWDELTRPGKGPPMLRAMGPLRVSGARVGWRDEASGRQVTVAPLAVASGAMRLGQAFSVTLQGPWQGFGARGQADFRTLLRLSAGQPPRLRDILLRIRADDLRRTAASGATRLAVSVPELARAGSDGPWQAPVLTADLRQGGRRIALRAALAYQPRAESLRLSALDIAANDVAAHGTLRVDGLFQAPRLALQAQVPSFDLRRVAADWHLPLPLPRDPGSLRRVAFRLDLTQTGDRWIWHLDDGRVDASRVQGDGVIRTRPFAARFLLRLDCIDLDRYLPARSASAGKGASAWRTWPLAGEIRVGRFRAGRLEGRHLALRLGYRDGRWQGR